MPPTPEVRSGLAAGVQPSLRPPRRSAISTAPTRSRGETEAQAPELNDDRLSRHSFGAQFAEVRVNADTGEIRVSRMLGVFSVGRVANPVTARSQLIGGMTMGIGMALHEHGVMDLRFGTIVNHDFADYHIPTCADIEDIDAIWLEEPEAPSGVLGARGLGEIGIVGGSRDRTPRDGRPGRGTFR